MLRLWYYAGTCEQDVLAWAMSLSGKHKALRAASEVLFRLVDLENRES